jgi:hypothetical protein
MACVDAPNSGIHAPFSDVTRRCSTPEMLSAKRTRWKRTRNPCIDMHRNTDTDFVDLCDFCVDSNEFKKPVVAETRVGLVLLAGR